MNLIDKFIYRLFDKMNNPVKDVQPVENVEDTASGLEEKIKKQLKKDDLDDKTRKQLENVLDELDTYRKTGKS